MHASRPLAPFAREGYTIIELLVALGILGIVTSQLFLVFTTQKKAYITNERILDVQEDARLVADLLVAETRMAGFMVPRETALSGIDGGNAAADVLCLSDPSVMDEARVNNANDKFDGASITALDPAGDKITLPNVAEFDIDGDGTGDFADDRGLILSDGTNTHCARATITDPNTLEIEFTPSIDDTSVYAVASVRVVPAVVYEVAAGGLGLSRNNMLLSSEVEDLQVEYGVDVNLDDVVDESDPAEFPLDSIDGSNPSRVRSVRLTVVTRTPQDDPDYEGPGYPGAANRAAGAADGFRRRRFVASVLPRNLL